MLGGQLPEHMRTGRGSFSGPLVGPYVAFTFGPITDAGPIANGANIYAALIMPFDFRVEAIAYTASAATADVDLMVAHNTSAAAGGTDLMAAVAAVDATTGAIITATSTPALAASADRNVAQGRYITIELDGDGADADISDFSVSVIGFPYGHVNADPQYD